jgi:hypothetical protein
MDIMCDIECEWLNPSMDARRKTLCALCCGLYQHCLMVADAVLVRNNRPGIRLKSDAHLMTLCSEWKEGDYRILQSKNRDGYELTVGIWPKALRLDLYLGGGQLELRRGSLITAFTAFLKEIIHSHAHDAEIGFAGVLSARNIRYPHVRPPRNWQVCDRSGLLDLIDVRFAARRGKADAAERLRLLDLPNGATREETGDVLIIQWASDADMKNDDLMKMRLSTREQSLVKALPDAPIMNGWNTDGEVEADPVAAQPHPPLTLYSPTFGVGYKAVHTAIGEKSIHDELYGGSTTTLRPNRSKSCERWNSDLAR